MKRPLDRYDYIGMALVAGRVRGSAPSARYATVKICAVSSPC